LSGDHRSSVGCCVTGGAGAEKLDHRSPVRFCVTGSADAGWYMGDSANSNGDCMLGA